MSRSKLGMVLFSSALAVFLVIGGVLGKSSSSSDGAYRQLGVYSEVLSRIKTDYVEEPDIKEVTSGALHGVLEALDPFSSYLTPEEYAEYQKKKNNGKGDLGLVVSKKFGYVAVVSALPGSPAAKAGLTNGDILESINGSSTREMSLEQAKMLFSGKPGTTLTASLVRASRAEPQNVTLKREVLTPTAVTVKQVEAGVGYLRVDSFPKGRASEIAQRLEQLAAGGARSLVLDLRNTAEGEISEATTTADLFLDHGLITYLQGQKYPRQDFNATAGGAKIKLPVVVLVNRGSAGPAEVLAAALQENGRAEVVGEKTYGVGSVQKIIPLDDGSALLLSVAKYYTPGGKAIQDNGVTPGTLVAESRPDAIEQPESDQEEDSTAPPSKPPTPRRLPHMILEDKTPPQPKEDLPLKRGIELLKGGAEKKAA